MSTYRILIGDCRETLRTLPDASVQCCVTSPPYWGLRDYGHDGQLGLEPTPEEYVANMVEVFREVRRVLRPDGTLWLNLGDSYASQGGAHGGRDDNQRGVGARLVHAVGGGDQAARTPPDGLKPKDLVGIPWRVAFALQADGWYLRSDIIWAKKNPMPESVTDRPTKAHEYVFLLAKSATYYYDADAIAEDGVGRESYFGSTRYSEGSGRNDSGSHDATPCIKRNARSVWTIATQPFSGAHFAVFPPELAERCILAGTSAKGCCPECGAPWERVVERTRFDQESNKTKPGTLAGMMRNDGDRNLGGRQFAKFKAANPDKFLGWRPTCEHDLDPVPCTVLDPFGGSGTTGMVATGHGRRAILCELKPAYADLMRERCGPMLESA